MVFTVETIEGFTHSVISRDDSDGIGDRYVVAVIGNFCTADLIRSYRGQALHLFLYDEGGKSYIGAIDNLVGSSRLADELTVWFYNRNVRLAWLKLKAFWFRVRLFIVGSKEI